MENKKEMTIPNVSAATDAEQSLSKCTDNSIVNQDTDFKGYEQSFEEMQREILRQLDPSYLKTVSRQRCMIRCLRFRHHLSTVCSKGELTFS